MHWKLCISTGLLPNWNWNSDAKVITHCHLHCHWIMLVFFICAVCYPYPFYFAIPVFSTFTKFRINNCMLCSFSCEYTSTFRTLVTLTKHVYRDNKPTTQPEVFLEINTFSLGTFEMCLSNRLQENLITIFPIPLSNKQREYTGSTHFFAKLRSKRVTQYSIPWQNVEGQYRDTNECWMRSKETENIHTVYIYRRQLQDMHC